MSINEKSANEVEFSKYLLEVYKETNESPLVIIALEDALNKTELEINYFNYPAHMLETLRYKTGTTKVEGISNIDVCAESSDYSSTPLSSIPDNVIFIFPTFKGKIDDMTDEEKTKAQKLYTHGYRYYTVTV